MCERWNISGLVNDNAGRRACADVPHHFSSCEMLVKRMVLFLPMG
jgi:hypothetical protein